MSRYSRSEVDIDGRYDDRRSYGGRRYDDYRETDVSFRTGHGAPPVRERARDEVRTPAFLRDDYAQTTAGPMVLRARDREDITYVEPRRRRSYSPESKKEKEEIVIRREERSESRPPPPRPKPRERSIEREEIVIRRDERPQSRPPPSRRRPKEESRESEEIIIRRDERSESQPSAPRYRERERSREREEIIIRRDERDDRDFAPPRRSATVPVRDDRESEEIIIRRNERDSRSRFDDDLVSQRSYQPPPPARTDVDRQEIIIRREQVESDDRRPPRKGRYEDDLARPVSHERARGRSHSSASEEEIIIRREERDRGRGGEESRQEIIIRKSSRSRSPSPVSSVSTRPPPAPAQPQVIYAPAIHQEVITHHRHIDHGYEVRQPPIREPVYERPPSPPSPPPPPPAPARDMSEERIEIRRSETRNGRSEDQDIVISRRERSQSAGPPARRFRERDDFEIDYYHEHDRALAPKEYVPPPSIGARYGARTDPRDRLWTEITKDLVVKEAILEMGYEYEETDDYYYIFKYMEYADVARLVGLSEDIRRDRHKRINEIRWENAVSPRPAVAPASPRAPLAIEGPAPRERPDSRGWNREDERYVEREVVYRGGRPPPPVGWRY